MNNSTGMCSRAAKESEGIMKTYTVYLDGDRGWTDNKIEGFYNEVKNAQEGEESTIEIPTEEEFNKNLEILNIGESHKVIIRNSELEVKCEDIPEEEFKNLDEFSGW